MYSELDETSNQNASISSETSRRFRKLEKKWTAEEDQIMVQMIQEREAIWNSGSSAYKNRDIKSKCWAEIAEKTNHSVSDVKIHWNTVKSRFNSERKKVWMSKSGDGAAIYKSKYELYQPLQFLLKAESRSSATNLVIETENRDTVEDSLSPPATPCNDGSPASLNYGNGEVNPTPILKKRKCKQLISPDPLRIHQRAILINEIKECLKSQREIPAKKSWKEVFSEYIFCELDRYEDHDAQNLKKQLTTVCLNFEPELKLESQSFVSEIKVESQEMLHYNDESQDDWFQ